MESWAADIRFERQGLLTRTLKALLVNPVGNYLPAKLLRGLLKWTKSDVAASNWADPGGWRSMVISYSGNPPKGIDKILVKGGTIPMALRNRRRLASRLISRLIDQAGHAPAHVLCLGAGPGTIIMDAMCEAKAASETTLVDISGDAFEHGRQMAAQHGLSERVKFIQGDVCSVKDMLDHRTDIVKMMGICEYLQDDQIVSIAKAVAELMPPGSALVFNSLSTQHGTDRFFRRVFGLHMIHRTPEQLQGLFSQAGFGNYVAFTEPLRVYTVVVGKKLSPAAGQGNP
ncbi:MAG: class I SAM-dependent methyltransferase family protein [Planctomycetaceae bacterium]|nr:class I SAM-dependent methyltransferase family protein [Planctomycetaceae bacterium]